MLHEICYPSQAHISRNMLGTKKKIEMASHEEESKCTGKSDTKENKWTSNKAPCLEM